MSFIDFWTNKNNPALPKAEYLYNFRHICVLIITVVLCVLLTLIFYKKSQKTKQKLFYVFGWIFLTLEVLSRIVNLLTEENFTFLKVLEILLPMHICSVMVWVFIIAIFSKNKTLINFSVIGGIIATIAFLLYPAVGLNRKFMSFTCLYSTISHMLGFVCCILLMTLRFSKFKIKEIYKIFICFAVMFLWGAILNNLIFPGADYMYLRNDPLELNLPFHYQWLYLIILVFYTLIFYLVPLIINAIKRKNKEKEK